MVAVAAKPQRKGNVKKLVDIQGTQYKLSFGKARKEEGQRKVVWVDKQNGERPYRFLLNDQDEVSCNCKGFYYHGKCKHLAPAAAFAGIELQEQEQQPEPKEEAKPDRQQQKLALWKLYLTWATEPGKEKQAQVVADTAAWIRENGLIEWVRVEVIPALQKSWDEAWAKGDVKRTNDCGFCFGFLSLVKSQMGG